MATPCFFITSDGCVGSNDCAAPSATGLVSFLSARALDGRSRPRGLQTLDRFVVYCRSAREWSDRRRAGDRDFCLVH